MGTGQLDSSIYAFLTDLHDEGVQAALDNIEDRAGLDGVSVALAYHAARDILPHNPRRKVQYFNEGAVYFRPHRGCYEALRIQPNVSALAHETDVLGEVCAEAGRRDLAVHAWVVLLHCDRPGEYPDCSPRNAFDDPYLTDLCPANPDAREYINALCSDVARPEIATVLAESLHFHPLEHGFHHERCFVELGSVARYLLGLCFCEHCLDAGRRAGVDADALKRFSRAEIERCLSGDVENRVGELTRDEVDTLCRGEMAGYTQARIETVTSLAADACEAARDRGSRFCFIDLSGGIKGYATGQPSGEPTASIGWQFGIDVARIGNVCDQVEVAGYAADVDRLRTDLEAYAAFRSRESSLAVALRPTRPDTQTAADLREKVQAVQALGFERIDFYHYGFLPLAALDWIQEALQ